FGRLSVVRKSSVGRSGAGWMGQTNVFYSGTKSPTGKHSNRLGQRADLDGTRAGPRGYHSANRSTTSGRIGLYSRDEPRSAIGRYVQCQMRGAKKMDGYHTGRW